MAMTAKSKEFDGLEWVVDPDEWDLDPWWTTDIDMKQIREAIRRVFPSLQEPVITFLGEGALNKAYSISIQDAELIMRVSLPVDPVWKTLSEVATLEWVRHNSHLPVPQVFAHDASRDNPIGFEWILMSKLPGRPLKDAWMSIDFAAKERLVHEVAKFMSSMFKRQLRGIGNLSHDSKRQIVDGREPPPVQRMVSMHLFWGGRVTQQISRGPYHSSRDWLKACLLSSRLDFESAIATWRTMHDSGIDYDKYVEHRAAVAEKALKVIWRLEDLLDDFFPSSKDEQGEPSILWHDDLAQRNILVDEAGALTGVVDWECVTAMPLWKACDYPSFLQGPSNNQGPLWERYGDGWKDLFRMRMVQYETTKLRKYFLEEMERLEPGWVKVFKASERLRDFEGAIRSCSDVDMRPYIFAWLQDVEQGKEDIISWVYRAEWDILNIPIRVL